MDRLRPLTDPRDYQVAVLAILVVAGSTLLDIGIEPLHAAVMLGSAQATQYLCGSLEGRGPFDPRSALVTGLSLTMLLRTDGLGLAVLAAVIAIGSKFLVRIRGKHLFNPANGAIVGLMLATDGAWVSSGQWGSGALSALALAGLGLIVLTRARRAETTLAFLGGYAMLLAVRAALLGDPLAIPLHHLANGALLVFAFFMISDPKTTPDSAAGRVIFGATVAGVAFVIQFALYRPYAPILALFFCMPLVPLLDGLLAGERYRWQAVGDRRALIPGQETDHANHRSLHDDCCHAASRSQRPGFLRFLRRPRGHGPLQPCLAGRAGPRRQADRHHDGQRLQRRRE